MSQARFRVTIRPPDGGSPRSFETLPLEPIEIRSLIYIATSKMLTEDGWSVTFERLDDGQQDP